VIWSYWRGEINMRKSAGVWLVDLPSMRAWYGKEKEKIEPASN
jgi:hypothetical protein